MALSLALPAHASGSGGFTDVSPGAWYAGAVEYVTSHDLFSGTSNTTFSPNAPMTRGMFVTVLARMAGVDGDSIADNHAFTDNDFSAWYGPSVEWAYENGFVNGAGGTLFLPNQNLTREQMAAIMYRFLDKLDAEIEDDPTSPAAFSDAGHVSPYAVDAVEEMRRTGFLKGSGGCIDPLRNITRAEAAVFFMRVDTSIGQFQTPVGVALSNTQLTLSAGEGARLRAYILPKGISGDVVWSSSDEAVASVDPNGNVVAKAAGEAVVTATAGKKSAVCTIKVLEKDTGNATFTVETAEYNLSTSPFFDGFIDTIKPTCNHAQSNSSDSFNDIVYGPGNWYRNVEDHFTFESSDTSVVTVTEKGHMYHAPLPNDSAPRTAYITVTHKADGTTLKVKVTVSIGEQYYEVNDDYIAAYAAEMLKLVNEARREAGLREVEYSTSPISQMTVNARAKELQTKYSHNRPNGESITALQNEMGCTEGYGLENIAMVGFNYMEVGGCLYTPNKPETEARYFFNLWMSDVGHKSTILAPVTGDRVMVCGLHVGKGNIYVVQWFATKYN